ncbi:MAG: hypothetical protein LLF76_03790 [Planctomycetaceae bacterium]|nr:hypothetical protein [Planctomycetaceae bacterium]
MKLFGIAICTGMFCILAAQARAATRYMERLDRGVVAVSTGGSNVYIGWRLFGTDPQGIGFNVYRGSTKLNASPITNSTNYTDTAASTSSTYSVRAVINGSEVESSQPVSVWAQQYLEIPLQVPAGGINPATSKTAEHEYTYQPNDASVGDLDGDGQYEIVLKWQPTDAQDNANEGYTGNTILDAYELNGTFMWRIDLGINIRSGAHYSQFMVYDLDSDGKAEVACKTAPYSVDGLGNYVLLPGDILADYRNASGYILSGPEYLTIFNGQTGAEMVTTNYMPPRGTVSSWGDNYGNRVDRFLACVAYLDGVHPSLVMCRGYYTRATLAAWDWRDGQLTQRWFFDSYDGTPGNSAYSGQGNHNLSAADVDGDGFDEIVYGSCTIDHDGTGLYSTGLGHGDAMHVSDMDPNRPGLEVWQCHEGGAGSTFRDAGTGKVIFQFTSTGDVGRACAGHVTAASVGYQMWANTSGLRDRYGNNIGSAPSSTNFVIWWDGDLQRELLNGSDNSKYTTAPYIDKYGGSTLLSATNCYSNNTTKATPCLSADILGDWREEAIWRTSDNTALRIYTTTAVTSERIYTLMHDPQYRLAIAWQNVAYNQPPHPGFYIGAGMSTPPVPDIVLVGAPSIYRDFNGDGIVNLPDLLSFAGFWLEDDCSLTAGLDLNEDCLINLYEFSVFAGNWAGADITPPLASTGISATAGNSTIWLDWNDNSETDLAGYKVYRSTTSGGGYTLLTDLLSGSSYIDNDVVNGTTYYYVVTALDAESNESGFSIEVFENPYVPSSIIIQENEPGFVAVDGSIDNDNAGFTGAGFANTVNGINSYVRWSVNAPQAGRYELRWRFANGNTPDRTAKVLVNGAQQAASVSFPATGAWTIWTVTGIVNVQLAAGDNVIELTANTANGTANIDWIEVTGRSPVPGN